MPEDMIILKYHIGQVIARIDMSPDYKGLRTLAKLMLSPEFDDDESSYGFRCAIAEYLRMKADEAEYY